MKAATLFRALAALEAVDRLGNAPGCALPHEVWRECMSAAIALKRELNAADLQVNVEAPATAKGDACVAI